MRTVLGILSIALVAIAGLLQFRIARFRKDRPKYTDDEDFFGAPSMNMIENMSPDTYTAEGAKLLPWMLIAEFLCLACWVAFMFLSVL